MLKPVLALIVAVLSSSPAVAGCDEPFEWRDGYAAMRLSRDGEGRVSIESSRHEAFGGESVPPGRLYILFRTTRTLVSRPRFWEPGSASLALAPPPGLYQGDRVVQEARTTFGDERPRRETDLERTPYSLRGSRWVQLLWTYHYDALPAYMPRPRGRSASQALERFQATGVASVELWDRNGREPYTRQSRADFDWSRVAAGVERAIPWFTECAVAGYSDEELLAAIAE